jgi:hypothetical protein
MGQHPEPNARRDEAEEDVEELGTPIYGGSSLSVRALTAAELQRFLDAHHGQPAQPLGSGWNALHPPGHPLRVPQIPPEAGSEFPGTRGSARARPGGGSLGSPGRSALAHYRRRRAEESARVSFSEADP